VEAIYSGAMPLDLIATEQQRITSQLVSIEQRLSATTATFNEIEANLARALDCHAAYLAADPQLRRLFNQAFFTHLYIDDDGLHSDYAEPFDTLLGPDTLDAGRTIQADREAGQITMADILRRPATSTNDKTPKALRATGSLSMLTSTPLRRVEGSNTSRLVHLGRAYSNRCDLLERIQEVLEKVEATPR
jgi:site-specific DNA recombinase